MLASSPAATSSSTSRSTATLVVVLAVASALAVLVGTRNGILRNTDSEVYLATSDSIWNGHGLTVPFTTFTDRYSPREAIAFDGRVPLSQFGPAYPLAISLVRVTGVDATGAARLLHAGLIALSVWLFAMLVRRLTPGAPCWAVGGGILVLLIGPRGTNFLFQHLFVASEPLFFACTLGALVLVDRALRSDATRDWVFVGLVTGAALASRFAGAGLAVGVVAIAFSARRTRGAVLVGALAAAPTLLFVAWSVAAGAGGRPIGWHVPDRIPHDLYGTLATWFAPRGASWLTWIVIVAVTAMVAVVVFGSRVPPLWGACGVAVVSYLAGILAAGTLFDHSLPVVGRLLTPVQPIALAVIVAAAARLGRAAPAAIAVCVLLLVAPGLRYTWRLEREAMPRNASRRAVPLLDPIARDVSVFTNDPLGIYYDTGRSSLLVPRRDDVFTGGANAHLAEQIEELRVVVCRGDAVVVLRGPSWAGVAGEADLGLAPVTSAGGDVLLGCPNPTPSDAGAPARAPQ